MWSTLQRYIETKKCYYLIAVVYEKIYKDLDKTRLAKGTRHNYTKKLVIQTNGDQV